MSKQMNIKPETITADNIRKERRLADLKAELNALGYYCVKRDAIRTLGANVQVSKLDLIHRVQREHVQRYVEPQIMQAMADRMLHDKCIHISELPGEDSVSYECRIMVLVEPRDEQSTQFLYGFAL